MTLRINEYNSNDMLSNSMDFYFENSFDKKVKERSIDRLLDFLITWYTGKKSIFSKSLFIVYCKNAWVISKDLSPSLFIKSLNLIVKAIESKELNK